MCPSDGGRVITDIRRPHYAPEYYDDKEGELLETYRSLGPQEQNYLIKQAHIYHQHDLDTPLSQEKQWLMREF